MKLFKHSFRTAGKLIAKMFCGLVFWAVYFGHVLRLSQGSLYLLTTIFRFLIFILHSKNVYLSNKQNKEFLSCRVFFVYIYSYCSYIPLITLTLFIWYTIGVKYYALNTLQYRFCTLKYLVPKNVAKEIKSFICWNTPLGIVGTAIALSSTARSMINKVTKYMGREWMKCISRQLSSSKLLIYAAQFSLLTLHVELMKSSNWCTCI